MERRSFFGHLAAAVAGLFGLSGRTPKPLIELPPLTFGGGTITGFTNWPKPPYLYSWSHDFTDDPAFTGKSLPYGNCNRVFVDGRDVSDWYITAMQTGRGGFVQYQDRDANGKIQLATWDHKERCWVDASKLIGAWNEVMTKEDGSVMTFADVKRTTDQPRIGPPLDIRNAPLMTLSAAPDSILYRYEETVKMGILEGHVEYFVVPLDMKGKPIVKAPGVRSRIVPTRSSVCRNPAKSLDAVGVGF